MNALEAAYVATGAGPWVWARRCSPSLVRGREAVWGFLRARGLSYEQIGRLTGYHHTTVLYGLRRTKAAQGRPLRRAMVMDPARTRQLAEVGVRADMGVWWDIWERGEGGKFLTSHRRKEARTAIWRRMKRDLSYPEIARACGMRSYSSIVDALHGETHRLSTG